MPFCSSVGYIEYTQVCLLLAAAAAAAVLLQLIEGVPFRDLLDDLCDCNQDTMITMHTVDAEVVLLNSFQQCHFPTRQSCSSS